MTYALTVWNPWAAMIVAGCKPYEFRRWAAPARHVGQRIVIHAGAHRIPRGDLHELLEGLATGETGTIHPCGSAQVARAIEITERMWRDYDALPFSAGLGTATLGKPARCIDLFRADGIDHGRIDPDMWAWPMLDPEPWGVPVPARGGRGFWEWPGEPPAARLGRPDWEERMAALEDEPIAPAAQGRLF
jgi:hypothetical protein